MTATQEPLWRDGGEQEPRVDFGALLDKANADYEAQRLHWVDWVKPDAVVDGRPAFNVLIPIDDWEEPT